MERGNYNVIIIVNSNNNFCTLLNYIVSQYITTVVDTQLVGKSWRPIRRVAFKPPGHRGNLQDL